MHRLPIICVAILALLLSGVSLFAQEATAGLSSLAAVVGRPVEMVITVRDARSAEVPQTLDVPGLRIKLMGRSTRFEMNNFKISSSLTYTYSVLPQQAGDFDIPAIEVRAGERTLKTNPLRLSVADASTVQPPQGLPNAPLPQMPPSGGQAPSGNTIPYFGELVLSKKKAYVGEAIPAELRYYFNSSIGGEVGDRPNLGGEGFTVQKLANVPKREQIVNGQNYIVFAFQTAITPAKSGTLEIPPAKLEARLQLPGSAPAGFDDFFRQFGGIAPPGMFTNMQEVAIETAPISLEISPLPKQDRPDDFTGAIGKFQMQASVSPKKAGPGDPITLRVVVSGQGNFDAMGAPVLVGDEEWRSYPPSEKFQSSDAIHFVGEKTYEFMLVARTDQQQTPGIRFSYFDPDTGKYETLTLNPLPVQARAGTAPVQTAEVAPDQKKAESPSPASTPNPAPMAKPGGTSRWTSLFVHPAFLMANAALALLWVIGLLLLLLRRRAASPAGLRRQKIQKLKSCLSTLESCLDGEFTPLAVRCLLVALDTENHPLNAGSLVAGLKADEETKAVLANLLVRDEESKYSAGGVQAIDRHARSRILSALKKIVS
ncbi:MAG: BatD family protein [Spartobacteria bacterium]